MNKPKWALNTVESLKGVTAVAQNNHFIAVRTQRIMKDGIRNITKEKIGIIVPDQLIIPDSLFSIGAVQIYEYGFSKALFDLCPLEWKNNVSWGSKRDWFCILLRITAQMSSNSYLVSKYLHSNKNEYLGVHRQSLEKMLSMTLNELYSAFGSVQLVSINGEKTISRMTPEQINLASTLHVNLEELI